MTIDEATKVLRRIRTARTTIERGEDARRRRDRDYLRGRELGVSIASLAKAAGVSENAVKFSLAETRRGRRSA